MSHWVAVDWGTSRLRAWLMEGARAVDRAASDDGMGRLAPAAFEPALLRLIGPWLADGPVDVVACGMVGARQGWIEAGYAAVPCRPVAPPFAAPAVADARLRVRIVPGLKQDAPPDVMRGEETQIAGHLALTTGFDGIVCLPGSHTKWTEISAGEVVSFRTFMTGELFAAIRDHTVLRHTMGKDGDAAAFETAVNDAMARPEALAQRLFGLRAEALLSGLAPDSAASRLSGLLIGLELAAARAYWLGREIALIGDEALARRYQSALTAQGVPCTLVDGEQATLAGLAIARDMAEGA
jgi:2-dehydro-3-deoxygalactonokinase